jgi:hypothetical protein
MGMAYAEKIMSIITLPNDYKKLRNSTRKYYDDYLNWESWAKTITSEIENSIV